MTELFKIVDGDIFMGETRVLGHCCNNLAEMEAYCLTLNTDLGIEFGPVPEITKISDISPRLRQRIIDQLKDI